MGERLGFSLKPALDCFALRSESNNLDRNSSAGVVLLGFVDGAHAAFAQDSDECVSFDVRECHIDVKCIGERFAECVRIVERVE